MKTLRVKCIHCTVAICRLCRQWFCECRIIAPLDTKNLVSHYGMDSSNQVREKNCALLPGGMLAPIPSSSQPTRVFLPVSGVCLFSLQNSIPNGESKLFCRFFTANWFSLLSPPRTDADLYHRTPIGAYKMVESASTEALFQSLSVSVVCFRCKFRASRITLIHTLHQSISSVWRSIPVARLYFGADNFSDHHTLLVMLTYPYQCN